MKQRSKKLMESGALALLSSPNEKLVSLWFATRFPTKPLNELLSDPPLRAIEVSLGSHVRYIRRALGNLSKNTSFIEAYDHLGTRVRTSVPTNVPTNIPTNVLSTKESEKKREESISPDPSLKKRERKGKEKGTSSSASSSSSLASNASSIDPMVGDAFKGVLQKVADSYVPGSDGMVTSGEDKKPIVGAEASLKYPNEFEVFFAAYPNRWGLAGVGYLRLKGFWKQAEEKGWEGPAILEALSKADVVWQAEKQEGKKVFIPDADKFLTEECYLRRYLPAMEVAKMLGAPVTNTDFSTSVTLAHPDAFEEFCTIYPKKRGLLDPKEKGEVAKAWQGCEKRGWQPYDIIRALKDALISKSWTENDGRFIPTAEKFLKEEQMRQFLSIGFKPNGGSTLVERPLTEEEAYWTNLENFA